MKHETCANAPGSMAYFALIVATLTIAIGWYSHGFYRSRMAVRDQGTDSALQLGDFNRHALAATGAFDSGAQRFAHKCMLLWLAGVSFLTVTTPLFRQVAATKPAIRLGAVIGLIAVVGFGLYSLKFARSNASYSAAGFLIVGVTAIAILWQWGPVALRRRWQWIFLVASLLLFCLISFPGAFVRLDLSRSSWPMVEMIQMHYSYLLAPADRLATGQQLFVDFVPVYGPLLPILLGSLQRVFGPISTAGYVLLMEAMQAVYLLIALRSYQQWSRGKWLPVLITFFFVGINYHFYNGFLKYPNHLAWRQICFPLAAMILLRLKQTRVETAGFVLGMFSAGSLAYNFEIGIAVSAGMLTYLFFQSWGKSWLESVSTLTKTGLRFLLGMACMAVSIALLVRIGLGEWPTAWGMVEYARTTLQTSMAGYNGREYQFRPLPIIVFFHASYTLVVAALRQNGRPDARNSFRAAIAALLLVWFAYFASSPAVTNFSGYLMLYGFLLIDSIRWLLALRRHKRFVVLTLLSGAELCLGVLPQMYVSIRHELPGYCRGIGIIMHPPEAPAAVAMSGVYLPAGDRAEQLSKKAAFLRQLDNDKVIFFTVDSYFIPKLAGIWSSIPMVDAFWESFQMTRYKALLSTILQSGQQAIYFDSPESIDISISSLPISSRRIVESQRAFFDELKHDLSSQYEFDHVEAGWEVWRRRGPD